MASSSSAGADALLLGKLPTEVKANQKYPEFYSAGCAIARRLCDDPNAFPEVPRLREHKATDLSAPLTYIYRKPAQPQKVPRTAEGLEVHVEGGGSIEPKLPKGDVHPVGSLVVYVCSASTKGGGHLRGKCFVPMRVKTAAAELKKGHLEVLEEDGKFAFVNVAPTILPVASGTIVTVASSPDEEAEMGDVDIDELIQGVNGEAALEAEERRELEHAVYDDHEPRIQENARALHELESRVTSLELGSDAQPCMEWPSPLEGAVLRVLVGGKMDKLEIRNRLMAGGFEHRDANGEVAELRAADVNRALYKMWKTEGKVIADTSGAKPIWSLVS